MTQKESVDAASMHSIVRRPPAVCCPECGRICEYDERGENYPCERCGVLWRWHCHNGKHEDIKVVQQCPDCDGQKFRTEQDYWDGAHCSLCRGEGVI